MTSALVLSDQTTLDGYRFWNVGSTAGRGTEVQLQVAPFPLLALASTPSLNAPYAGLLSGTLLLVADVIGRVVAATPAGRAVTRPTAVASRPAVRLGPLSAVWRPRQVAVCTGLSLALLLAFAANVGRGDYPIPLLDVLAVFGGGTVLGAVGLPLAALSGGLGVSVLLYLLAWRDGVDGLRLVLIGIGLTAVLVACTSWMLISAEIADAYRAVLWITGSLNGRGWAHIVPVGLAVGVVGVLARGRHARSAPCGQATTAPGAWA